MWRETHVESPLSEIGDPGIPSPRFLVVRTAYLALAIPASVLSFTSYFAYTTAGFDFESASPRGIEVSYYRIRWDDGSTWAGLAVQPLPHPGRPLDWFDPGGTILAAPTRPRHQTWSNTLGFWWIDGPKTDPYVPIRYPGSKVSRWLGIPSWLVILILWLGPASRRCVGFGRLLWLFPTR